MIPITRVALPVPVSRSLERRTKNLQLIPQAQRTEIARSRWRMASELRRQLLAVLATMAHGRNCCNYCSDSLGTDVDHYCPIAEDPLSTFEWRNHLLACSRCNSHAKRDIFPRDATGTPLIIDPTAEDPWDHLRLTPSTGEYVAMTEKGRTTKELLLDTDLLARGRQAAWLDVSEHVAAHYRAVLSHDSAGALVRQFRLLQRPNLDAFYAMLRWSEIPSASVLFEEDCLKALNDLPDIYRSWLSLGPRPTGRVASG